MRSVQANFGTSFRFPPTCRVSGSLTFSGATASSGTSFSSSLHTNIWSLFQYMALPGRLSHPSSGGSEAAGVCPAPPPLPPWHLWELSPRTLKSHTRPVGPQRPLWPCPLSAATVLKLLLPTPLSTGPPGGGEQKFCFPEGGTLQKGREGVWGKVFSWRTSLTSCRKTRLSTRQDPYQDKPTYSRFSIKGDGVGWGGHWGWPANF